MCRIVVWYGLKPDDHAETEKMLAGKTTGILYTYGGGGRARQISVDGTLPILHHRGELRHGVYFEPYQPRSDGGHLRFRVAQ